MWGEGDSEKRAVAALSTVQLITTLLEAIGLQIRLTNGTAQMFTGRIQNEMLSAFIAERVPASSGAGELNQAALEVLSCIAFKQPISQGKSIKSSAIPTSATSFPCSTSSNFEAPILPLNEIKLGPEIRGPSFRRTGAGKEGAITRLSRPHQSFCSPSSLPISSPLEPCKSWRVSLRGA